MLAKEGMATQTGQTQTAFWWIAKRDLSKCWCQVLAVGPWTLVKPPTEVPEGRKCAQQMHLPTWVSTSSALKAAVLGVMTFCSEMLKPTLDISAKRWTSERQTVDKGLSWDQKDQGNLSRSSRQEKRAEKCTWQMRCSFWMEGSWNDKGLSEVYFIMKLRSQQHKRGGEQAEKCPKLLMD